MSGRIVTSESFGLEVLGPIFAEFYLRLWSLGALLTRPEEAALLFCARGGLRIQLGYETFLRTSGLQNPIRLAPLMVSRLAAIRPALMRTVREGRETLLPATSAALRYEMPRASLSDVAVAMSGVAPERSQRWDDQFTPDGFAALLHHPDGLRIVTSLAMQADLFTRHLRRSLDRRHRAILVDTGLFGTTGQLLAEGFPDLDISSALIARSNYRREKVPRDAATVFGLSVQADGYSPVRRRTAMLRYWHFIESLFEPDLESVRSFTEERGEPRSNLEIQDWQARVRPAPGSAYAGLMQYLESLPRGPAEYILSDVDRAWYRLHRAIVWPNRSHGHALKAGLRSYDFGSDVTFTERKARGAVAALRGSSMWREGEIARSGSIARLPLLAGIETAYGVRRLKRAVEDRRDRITRSVS